MRMRSRRSNNDMTELLGSERASKKSNRRCCCAAILLVGMVVLICAVMVGLAVAVSTVLNRLPSDPHERSVALLAKYPLIDGSIRKQMHSRQLVFRCSHNDLPYQYRLRFDNQLSEVDLTKNTTGKYDPPWHADIPRLLAGHVGAQFWSAYMPCDTQYRDATRTFIDQMDLVKLLVHKYPEVFRFATSVADIEAAYDSGHIASLIGVEGGHAIDSSLATLRQIYALGGRYMTLTHTCNTPWAHSSVDNGSEGLNDFGRNVVREMNRLGMLVDISHVNSQTMLDVLETSVAPVIFSHSSAYALCNVTRNVPDNVLSRLKENDGIVMATFVPYFINCSSPANATLSDVADHIDHLKSVAGVDHVGIGSDFNGVEIVPHGLEDVSKYPSLFAELIRRGYSDSDVAKISRLNLLRVFKAVEKVRDDSQQQFPDNSLIQPQPNETCRTDF